MQTIQISDAQFKKLSVQATAAGYEDVAAYVQALVEDAAFDPRCGMNDDELRRSAAECDTKANRMKQEGGGRDFHQAWMEIGQELGFKQG